MAVPCERPSIQKVRSCIPPPLTAADLQLEAQLRVVDKYRRGRHGDPHFETAADAAQHYLARASEGDANAAFIVATDFYSTGIGT
jgi:hypothetical protein